MRRTALLFIGLLLALISYSAGAATRDSPVNFEIDALLDQLLASGCEFKRNGTWYPAREAEEHLLVKRKYLDSRRPLLSAEQFIELAASKSMVTGRPYMVRCGNAAPVPSAVWLSLQLQTLRTSRPDQCPVGGWR